MRRRRRRSEEKPKEEPEERNEIFKEFRSYSINHIQNHNGEGENEMEVTKNRTIQATTER